MPFQKQKLCQKKQRPFEKLKKSIPIFGGRKWI